MSGPRSWWSPRGVPLGPRLIAFDRIRFGITIAGIGFAVVLLLFLIALYDGVRTESNGYIASRPVHAWVAQDNTTNFIKSSSFLMAAGADVLSEVDGVIEVTPLLRLITTVHFGDRHATAIILGFAPQSVAGRPEMAEGSAVPGRGEIVLDRALASQLGVRINGTLTVHGRAVRVVGLSRGTNSVMTQLAFIPLDDARELFGVPQVASFLLVRGAPEVSHDALVERLAGRVPRTSVFTREQFAANNMQELEGGFLPILATVAMLGGIVALAILTLLLYGAILEQRETYAVLKAIGAPDSVLTRLILFQSLAAVVGGMVFGVAAYALCAPLVLWAVPVMALSLSPSALAAVGVAFAIIGMVGALLPLRRVQRIHPAELFRA